MKDRQGFFRLVAICACAVGAIWYGPLAGNHARAQVPAPQIQSLIEPDQGFAALDTSSTTGLVTFASSPGQGILLPLDASVSAEARAVRFVNLYGRAFGLTDSSQVQLKSASQADALGVEHVRLQQMHRGVPVRAGEFIVHLKGARAMGANGHITNDLPDLVIPSVPASAALTEARHVIEKYRAEAAAGATYSEPRLEIFNPSLLSSRQSVPGSRLAWFVEATGDALREFIWIDAQTGSLLLNFSQIADALSRTVYNANHVPDTLPGTQVRVEGGPATGDADQDNAYTFAGLTYSYYQTNHGRDSFDNAGGTIISSAHYCPTGSCPSYANAFWNGTQMVYGDTYASADDVVAHELTHAVTERTAGLLYYVQSGALNESFSDIFGETVDLTDGVGNDAAVVRWQIGEDLPIHAIRDMMTPTLFGDPGKMSDASFFVCNNSAYTDQFGDRGGVHTNSGIPNHGYALMVDGGTYNGRTITGIGLFKAGKIEYRALTTYLTSGANFIDDYNALNQSCSDLTGSFGITGNDCAQVTSALQAVEMNATWACPGATAAPALCPTGTPNFTQIDGFETGNGNWTPSTITGGASFGRTTGFAKTGLVSMFGSDVGATSETRLTMTNAVTVPPSGRLFFNHAYEFENDSSFNYDGGVLEMSTDNGATWFDAANRIDAGQNYGGVLAAGTNPLAGRSAFVKSSFGYTGTRLDLQGVAGTAIKIRFRIGTDIAVGSLGWLLDNIGIYECVGVPAITFQPANQTTNSGASAVLNVAATGGSLNYQWYAGSAGTTTNPVGTNSSAFTTPPLNGLVRYWVRVSNSFGSTDSSAATIFVTFTDAHTVTDSTLTTGVTPVRAVHVLELRTRIDALRVANALGAFPWTNATLSVHTTVIAPVDIAELRTALTAVYTARSLPTPTFTGAITTGTVIRALHIAELRNAVTAIEP